MQSVVEITKARRKSEILRVEDLEAGDFFSLVNNIDGIVWRRLFSPGCLPNPDGKVMAANIRTGQTQWITASDVVGKLYDAEIQLKEQPL